MQAIHEGGHVAAALLTGGSIRRVVLVPWELSRTDLIHNPYPLIVSWAGPVGGAIFPAFAWLMAILVRSKLQFWLRFLTGFCLIANGAYIGVGALTLDGDAGDMLRAGGSAWMLLAFGVITVPLGLAIWHGLGKQFGIGADSRHIGWNESSLSFLKLVAIVVIELNCAKVW